METTAVAGMNVAAGGIDVGTKFCVGGAGAETAAGAGNCADGVGIELGAAPVRLGMYGRVKVP